MTGAAPRSTRMSAISLSFSLNGNHASANSSSISMQDTVDFDRNEQSGCNTERRYEGMSNRMNHWPSHPIPSTQSNSIRLQALPSIQSSYPSNCDVPLGPRANTESLSSSCQSRRGLKNTKWKRMVSYNSETVTKSMLTVFINVSSMSVLRGSA